MLTRFRHFRFGAILGPLIPFFATLLALLVGAVMLLALGANPLDAYGALVKEAFGSPNALADTVVKAPPLLWSPAQLLPLSSHCLCRTGPVGDHPFVTVGRIPGQGDMGRHCRRVEGLS